MLWSFQKKSHELLEIFKKNEFHTYGKQRISTFIYINLNIVLWTVTDATYFSSHTLQWATEIDIAKQKSVNTFFS
jgi:hypothetical protein